MRGFVGGGVLCVDLFHVGEQAEGSRGSQMGYVSYWQGCVIVW